jgi:hypothetical protein
VGYKGHEWNSLGEQEQLKPFFYFEQIGPPQPDLDEIGKLSLQVHRAEVARLGQLSGSIVDSSSYAVVTQSETANMPFDLSNDGA